MTLKSMKSVALAAAAAVGLSLAASAEDVAKIEDQGYETLHDALRAAQWGDTVTLLTNCDLLEPFTNENNAVTVNLNEKTVTYAGAGFAFRTKGEDAKLTISNGTFNATGDGYFFLCEGESQFVLYGVKADQASDGDAIVLSTNARNGFITNCEIGGTEQRTKNAVKISRNTNYEADYNCVTIENSKLVVPGTVTKSDSWKWNDFYSYSALMFGGVRVAIKGDNSEMRGPVHAIYASNYGGELSIEGGKFSTEQDFFATLAFDHASYSTGWKKIEVTITGGEFTGRIFTYGTTALNIEGGTFNSFQGWDCYENKTSSTKLNITGGKFDSDPNLFAGVKPNPFNANPSGVKPMVATAEGKVAVLTSDDETETWEIFDATKVSAVPGANSKLTKLTVAGEDIYDAENPVVGTIFPYSVSGMVVEGFEPVTMKVARDTEVAATYEANEGYYFGEWLGDESETTQEKSGVASEEVLDLDGDDASLPPPHEHVWSDWTTNVVATCTEEGYETRTCTEKYCTVPPAAETNVLAAIGHDFGEWYVVTEPQAGIEGVERRDCRREGCGHCETRAIDPLPPVTDVVTTNAMANASWGYTISGLGDDHRDVALVFTNAAETAMSWRVPQNVTSFEFLVVGGGGSGGSTPGSGNYAGGGGGAGGMATGVVATVTSGTQFAIEVGKGGEYSKSTTAGAHGQSGSDSKLAVGETPYVIAKGGGYGGGYPTSSATVGGSGGSAGAAGGNTANTATAVGTATSLTDYDTALNLLNDACGVSGEVLGHNAGGTSGAATCGSGGGGAGTAGAKGPSSVTAGKTSSGVGGDGAVSFITGEEVYYAGGGGGGCSANTSSATTAAEIKWGALGGKGGGGQGGSSNKASAEGIGGSLSGKNGTENSGGGGGGMGYWTAAHGGNGGSGVVIIRYTAGAAPEPTGPTVDGDATIAATGDGQWTVTPNGAPAITVSGLKDGDKVTVPVDTVDTVAGVPTEDLILTVNDVVVDNQYFVGLLDGGTAFITELGEKAAPVIGEEGVETPFVVGESAEVTIKAIPGLYYQLIRGGVVTEIGKFVDEKTLEGVVLTITLTDDDKPSAGAFYKVGVTKGPQMTDK